MGGKTSTSTSQVQIPQDVLNRYNQVNDIASGAAQNPFQKYSTDPNAFVAQLNPLDIEKYQNPYINDVVNSTMNIVGQQNQQAQAGQLGTAISSGAFGGDRSGIAAANLNQQQMMGNAQIASGLYSDSYNQALGVAQQQQQAQQQTDQAGLSALYNQFMQQQAYPFQTAQFLANIAEGTGALSGSTTTTQQPYSFFSDRRLKEKIRRIGKADNGLPIYSFNYKGDDMPRIGFMADEVEKKHPDAVGTDPNSGYKTVDYERAARARGGLVPAGYAGGGAPAGPYGAAVGSSPGLGGYVPDAYLPVGQLVVSDPALGQQAQDNLANMINASASLGDSIVSLKNDYGTLTGGGPDASPVGRRYRGGLVRRADGGAVNPVQQQGYMGGVLAQQAQQPNPKLQTAQAPSQGQSDFSKVANIAETAMKFMNRGGVAGYADGGAPSYDGYSYTPPGGLVPPAPIDPVEIVSKPTVPDYAPTGLGAAAVAPASGNVQITHPEMYADMAGRGQPAPTAGAGGLLPSSPHEAGDVISSSLMPKPRPAPAGLGAADLAAAGIGTPQSAPGGVLPPIRDMGEITPAPMPHGTAKLPGPTVPSGLGSPVGHARVSIPAGSMQEHVMNVFTNSGLPPVVGAGILLNIGSESSFNPAASGDSHQSYGFVQWYKDRKDRYLSAANKAGINPADPTFQSAYIVKDLRDNYPEVLAAMEQAKTPGEAAVIFLDGYEKPAQQYRDQRAAEYMGAAQPVWGGGSGGGNGITRSTMGGDPRQGGDIWSNVKDMAINPETGKLDKNFLLSVLSGLGTMASSPSRYLGAAMLQGLGGFANTEAGLQKQAADIGLTRAGTSQTNVGTLNDVIGGAAAYNMSVPDYAAMIGYDLPPGYVDRSGIGSTVGVIPGADGGGFAAMSAQDMATAYKSGAVGPDGIPLNQDPAFLNQMLAKMAILSSVPLYKNMVEDAQAKLAQINASGISTGSTPGSVVVNPGMRGAANDASTAEANRVATAEFRGKAMAAIPQLQGQAANIDHMVDIYSGFQPGALTDLNTNVTAILQAFGAPVSGDAAADAASAQTVVKNMTAQMIAQLSDMPGGAPRAEIDQLSKLAADPNLQPDSVRAILAMSKGMTQWQTDYYSPGMRDAFVKAGGDPYDQTGYTSWFSQASPLSKYMEDAKAAIHVKGETVEAPAAVSSSGAPLPDGTTAPDISGGKPWVVHNGKWAQ